MMIMRLSAPISKAALLVLPFVIVFALVGCSGSSGSIRTRSSYQTTGVLVRDLDQAAAEGVASVLNNSKTDSTLELIINTDTLTWMDGVYTTESQSSTAFLSGSYLFSLDDGGSFDQSATFNLPAAPGATVTDPPNRLNTGGAAVSVDISSAMYADGYAVAAVHRDSAYSGFGYSAWVTSGATGVTIPPDAFRLTDGLNPDTGWYYVYIYAYADSPDSALSNVLLPVPLPSVLSENIDERDLTGRIGGVTVSLRDSVRVPVL